MRIQGWWRWGSRGEDPGVVWVVGPRDGLVGV